MMDDKALDALALALAKKLHELVTDDNDMYICAHPGEACPPDAKGKDGLLDCNICLSNYILPTIREALKEAAKRDS